MFGPARTWQILACTSPTPASCLAFLGRIFSSEARVTSTLVFSLQLQRVGGLHSARPRPRLRCPSEDARGRRAHDCSRGLFDGFVEHKIFSRFQQRSTVSWIMIKLCKRLVCVCVVQTETVFGWNAVCVRTSGTRWGSTYREYTTRYARYTHGLRSY